MNQSMDETKKGVVDKTKKISKMEKFRNWVYKELLFIVTIVFIAGACAGVFGSTIFYEKKLTEVIKVGGTVLENKVYDVKIRP